jgi:hypothetical protein
MNGWSQHFVVVGVIAVFIIVDWVVGLLYVPMELQGSGRIPFNGEKMMKLNETMCCLQNKKILMLATTFFFDQGSGRSRKERWKRKKNQLIQNMMYYGCSALYSLWKRTLSQQHSNKELHLLFFLKSQTNDDAIVRSHRFLKMFRAGETSTLYRVLWIYWSQ